MVAGSTAATFRMIEDQSSKIRIGLVGAILLASSIIYFLLPINALRWTETPFAGFLLDPNLVVTESGKSEWLNQEEPPLGYPYRLTAFNHTPISSNRVFYALLRARDVGDEVTLTFELPHNSRIESPHPDMSTRTVTTTLTRYDSQQLGTHFWLLYLIGLIILIIGIWTFLARPRVEAAHFFATFAALGALAVGLIFDATTTQIFIRVWLVALSFAVSLNMVLVFIFPHESRLVVRFPHLKWLVLLPGLVICVWGQWWVFNTADPWSYVIPWRAAFLLNGAALLVSWGMMLYRGTQSPSPFVRQQGRIVLASAVLGFLPMLTFFLTGAVNSPGFGWLVPELYVPPVVIYPLIIGYLIIRHRLMDMAQAVRRGLAYGLLLALLLGGLALIVTGLGAVIDTSNPLFLALVIVLVTVVFAPLRDGLQRELDRLVFRKPARLNELLREYSRELKTAVTTPQVQSTLLKYAEAGLPQTNPQLFLPDSETNCYTNGNGTVLKIDSALAQVVHTQTGAIDLTEERTWPEAFEVHKEVVQKMGAAVIVPMNTEEELLGWLTLTRKGNQQNYSQGELTYLEDLADQSLIGLERANVVERLELRVAELDSLNQFAQLLNYMLDLDNILELTYTNFRRMFDVTDFYITLHDAKAQALYTVFYVENGERKEECEGRHCLVEDEHLREAVEFGQMVIGLEGDGRYHIVAPLNAGVETIGTIHAYYHDRTLSRHQVELFEIFADRAANAIDRLQSQEILQARAQQLETINEITLSLATMHELNPLLELILDKAIELLNAEAGTFMLVDEDTGELEFRVVRGPASSNLMGTRLPIGAGIAGTVAQSGRPLITNRAQEDRRRFAEVDQTTTYTTQSMLTVPLILQNAVLGILQVINKRNELAFDEADQRLLTGFAAQAVVALDNARLLTQTDEALQQRVNELFMLQQLDRDLNTTLDLDQVLGLTLDWSLRICNGTAGAIVLVGEDGQLTVRATHGYNEAFGPTRIAPEAGLVRQVLASGRPHNSGNVQVEPHYVPAAPATNSQLTLPIIHKRQTVGALIIESEQPDAFDVATAETAVRVTNHAAVAISNALLYEQINEANQAKSEFVSMVSHELKTPMTAIRGFTDLLLSGVMGELTDKQRNFLDIISHNIKRMGTQVQDLTDISRIESGRLHMEFALTPFANIISETLPSVQAQYDEKNIHIHLDLPPNLPPILADKNRIIQVLTNLLSNACKYSPPSTDVYVAFKMEQMAGEFDAQIKPMVICSVKDSGYGISEADQLRLFTKFFRSDDPNIRQAPGTGLGLSITKGIVELHGGRMWFESAAGSGTTFHFAIPQAQEI